MLEYDKTMALLEEMRPHYHEGFTSSERSAIEKLYNRVCGKPIRRSGCSDCYRDAYIEVVTTLKRLGTMPITSNYVLKAGAVLHEFGSSDFYTLGNCPDEFAEKWLARFPKDEVLFEKMPSDWMERVEKVKATLGICGVDPTEQHKAESTDTADPEKQDSLEQHDADTAEPEKPRRGRPSNK